MHAVWTNFVSKIEVNFSLDVEFLNRVPIVLAMINIVLNRWQRKQSSFFFSSNSLMNLEVIK